MAWTTPATFVSGAILSALQMNTNVRDNTNALYGSQRRFAQGTRTTDYTFNASTVAAATDVFSSDLSWTADGSTYKVEFFCGRLTLGGTAYANIHLVNGAGTDLAMWSVILTTGMQAPVHLIYYYTPSAGAQTLNVRCITPGGGGTCTLGAGAGGLGTMVPVFLNVYGPDIT